MKKQKKALVLGILLFSMFGTATVITGCHFHRNNENENMEESWYGETDTQLIDGHTINTEVDTDINETANENQAINPDAYVDLNAFKAYQNPEMYTYGNLEGDIQLLQNTYEPYVTVDSLGATMDGRNIYHLVVGNPDAEHKLFINGGIHGREYMTSQLVMKQTITYLEAVRTQAVFEGNAYKDFWQNCAVHVVPMINPDGITISQYGLVGLVHEEVRDHVSAIADREGGAGDVNYFRRWKSNGNGVDLNRNFDALWENYDDHVGMPSADHYKGTHVGCETESQALINLTIEENFDASISYHTQGSVIYWYFGQQGALYEDTLALGEIVSQATGYPMDANYEYLDPAGYKDWCIDKMGIPSLTVEIGKETSPVPHEQFADVWERNRYVWEKVIQWILNK